ncbi:flagellar basal body rod C-terminal domain-containing protein [Oceanibacterium hippocampi]|nr:flagellar basal body rod C-terminal domain-containing protein [Oceanibacterium hippocampi]
MAAATQRLTVSAGNVANINTSAPVERVGDEPDDVYRPRRVEQAPAAGGGVQTSVRLQDPPLIYGPDGTSAAGLRAYPNVDPVREAVDQMVAVSSYKANASVLAAQSKIDETLLDLKS